MFCSRLNENSRQAKVSQLSLVLWLNENVRIITDVFSPWHSPSKLGLCSFGLTKTFSFFMHHDDILCLPCLNSPYGDYRGKTVIGIMSSTYQEPICLNCICKFCINPWEWRNSRNDDYIHGFQFPIGTRCRHNDLVTWQKQHKRRAKSKIFCNVS